jgi:thioredoxin-related protein
MKYLIYFLFLIATAFGYSQNWNTNFEEAKAKAEKENKNILLVFSGSDWCGPCIKLEKVVWKSPEFQAEADKNWVIYRADFPNKRKNQPPPDMIESNNKLADKYNKNGIFPLVMLLDAKGKVIGKTGFKNVSAQDYIKLIHSFK